MDWIGFPAECPAVTPPGGSSCAQPIHQDFGDDDVVAEEELNPVLKKLGIRRRKCYATRHTFISCSRSAARAV